MSSRTSFGLAALLVLAVPTRARAHGREPMLGAIAFDPSDPTHLVVRTTWTLLESRDDGATWTWRCAPAVGYDRTTEDPPVVVTESHEIVAGLFDGIATGSNGGCDWALTADPDARGTYSIDVERDPLDPGTVWAVQSPGAADNTIVRSTDEGATWEVVGVPRAGEPIVLLERIAIAPSDPMRVYVSGASPATAVSPTRRAFFYASIDGGRTYVERELTLEGEERNLHVLAVDPTDPDRVFMRVTRRVTDEVPERLLLSEDGGETWETAASLLEITGFTMSDDGVHAWVGGWDGAFLRSDLRGAVGTFVPVVTDPDLRVRCLGWRPPSGATPGELWVCQDDLLEPFALGRSSDLGETITRVWGFEDASPDTGCSECSDVGLVCPGLWPDVVFDLGLMRDAGVDWDGGIPACLDADLPPIDAGPDAGPPAPPPPSCGCRSARTSPPGAVFLLALALVLRVARARARTAPFDGQTAGSVPSSPSDGSR